MTLTNRLTLFFLAGLAVVLAAFSGTLFALARTHLYRQLNDRATATLDTLVAAAEVERDGIEWELHSRRLHFRGDGPPVWAVYDESGHRLDGSPDSPRPLGEFAEVGTDMEQSRVNATWDDNHWRVVRRTVRHPAPETVRSTPERPRYKALVFVTVWPVAPVHGLVNTLAWSLAGVSVVLWVAAGLASRWVCRRALAPVSRMTDAAKLITSTDQGSRLPVPDSRDELRDLATAFNDLLTRLELAFARQRQFTGEASHQLRTPLTAMLGQMEVALRRDREPQEYRRVLTTAVSQAGRLKQVVEALLFLARADSEAEAPGVEPVDIAPWLRAAVTETWAGHPRFADITLEIAPGEYSAVLAPPLLLAQAVDNLIDNAIKYSPPGSPVRVAVAAAADEVRITVSDEGPGIAAAETGRVFEPFFRSEDARRRGVPGFGLGLSVAARVVAALGGKIVLGESSGRGSRFEVRLPARR